MSTRWLELKKATEQLAESLHKYAKYLEAQNEKVLTLQHASTPACSTCNAVALFTLPVKDFHTSSTLDALLPVYNALKEKQYYEPLFLNDLAPIIPRDRYHFIQNLKENGCQLDAVLYTYSTGNNKGNYHFLWLISPDSSADEVQSQNAALIQTLNADMPTFHSCVMRQNFISLFGRMANVKPAYLREIYHELTRDCSAASSEIECHVNVPCK